MKIGDLIEELKQKEIEITFSAGKLKYSGPEEDITPDLLENLKTNKGKLIKYYWPKKLSGLMPINPVGNKTPLFVVHGDNSNYIISEHLGPDQPVYGFFHVGSEGEKIPFKSVREMAKSYLDKILEVCPQGPYYLIGYSFGGILAFEIAVHLQKSGLKVPFLVLIDSISPLARYTLEWQSKFFKMIRKNILGPLRRKIKRNIKLLVCKSFIIISKPIPTELRKFYMYTKYLKLGQRYSPTKFEGRILLFRTTNTGSSYKYLGWETLVNDIRMIEIDGKHLEIFIGEDRKEILKIEIEKYLADVKGL